MTPTSTPHSSSYSYPSLPASSVLKSRYSAIPTKSWSSIAAAGSQAAESELTAKYFDCAHQDYGCGWLQSNYNNRTEYCGSSPYKVGHVLSDSGVVVAISKDGSGDCESEAGSQCCEVLAKDPCSHGEKYLECHQA